MTSSLGAVFLFGKLPAHGDFVARGLSADAHQAWDDWASAALEQLRAGADDFDAAHDTVPPWRFIAGPSVLGERWRCGALAPSVDSAGRRFVVAAGFEFNDARHAAVLGLSIAEATEALLYRALGEGLTADDTVAALAADLAAVAEQAGAAEAIGATPSGVGAWWSAGRGIPPRAAAAPPSDIFVAACAHELRSTAA